MVSQATVRQRGSMWQQRRARATRERQRAGERVRETRKLSLRVVRTQFVSYGQASRRRRVADWQREARPERCDCGGVVTKASSVHDGGYIHVHIRPPVMKAPETTQTCIETTTAMARREARHTADQERWTKAVLEESR